jgi:hypothetical protein
MEHNTSIMRVDGKNMDNKWRGNGDNLDKTIDK